MSQDWLENVKMGGSSFMKNESIFSQNKATLYHPQRY